MNTSEESAHKNGLSQHKSSNRSEMLILKDHDGDGVQIFMADLSAKATSEKSGGHGRYNSSPPLDVPKITKQVRGSR